MTDTIDDNGFHLKCVTCGHKTVVEQLPFAQPVCEKCLGPMVLDHAMVDTDIGQNVEKMAEWLSVNNTRFFLFVMEESKIDVVLEQPQNINDILHVMSNYNNEELFALMEKIKGYLSADKLQRPKFN